MSLWQMIVYFCFCLRKAAHTIIFKSWTDTEDLFRALLAENNINIYTLEWEQFELVKVIKTSTHRLNETTLWRGVDWSRVWSDLPANNKSPVLFLNAIDESSPGLLSSPDDNSRLLCHLWRFIEGKRSSVILLFRRIWRTVPDRGPEVLGDPAGRQPPLPRMPASVSDSI